MNFALTEELEILRSTVRDFANEKDRAFCG